MKPWTTAKQIAFRDIAEDCRKERESRGISPMDPMGPLNCLFFEEAICEYAAVEKKPDFRKFNGGYHPKKQ